MKKIYEQITDTIKDSSRDIRKTTTETSIRINKVVENLNDNILETMNIGGIIASYFSSALSKMTNLEHTSQFKLIKGS